MNLQEALEARPEFVAADVRRRSPSENSTSSRRRRRAVALAGWTVALALLSTGPSARANVYATDIKLNGGMANVSVGSGTNVTISYILNAPATNVIVKILSGANAVRTLSFAGNIAGKTTRGTNAVTWDGKDDSHQLVPGGNYAVSITAASAGYPVWTQTTTDYLDTGGDAGTYVWHGRGIAVDANTN